jgi:hypothetical protein
MSSGESFGVDLEIPAGGFCFLAFSFTGVGSDVGSHGREQSPRAAGADVGQLEAVGALNFLDLDDILVKDEGELIDPRSIHRRRSLPLPRQVE